MRYDAVDVFGRQLVVIRDLNALVRRVDEKRFAVAFAFLHHHNAGGNGGAEKEVGGKLNDAIHKVVSHEIPPYLLFRTAAVHIIPGKQTIAAVPFAASHERLCMINAISALLFGASTPAGEKRGSLISSGLSSPAHLMEYGGLDTISSNGSSSQCAGGQRILAGNIKFVISDVMQKHIDAAEVVSRDVDLLPVKAVTDGVLAKHLFGFQQQRPRPARGVYKNVVFDTNRKSLLRHISAEKGLK